jgi:hypothetical protein
MVLTHLMQQPLTKKLVAAAMIVYPKQENNGVARGPSAAVNLSHELAKAASAVQAVAADRRVIVDGTTKPSTSLSMHSHSQQIFHF